MVMDHGAERTVFVLSGGEAVGIGTERVIEWFFGDIRPVSVEGDVRSWLAVDERGDVPRIFVGEDRGLMGATERHIVPGIACQPADAVKACCRGIAMFSPQRRVEIGRAVGIAGAAALRAVTSLA